MIHGRSKVPECHECRKDAPPDLEKEACPSCARSKKHPQEGVVVFLLEKLTMQDNGCPVGRDELRNHEWRWLGVVKDERVRVHEAEAQKP